MRANRGPHADHGVQAKSLKNPWSTQRIQQEKELKGLLKRNPFAALGEEECEGEMGPPCGVTGDGPMPCELEGVGMVTANIHSMGSLYNYLEEVDDDTMIVCAQEHRLERKHIAQASDKLRKMGWESFWAAARKTTTSTSGGTCILVRDKIQAWVDSHEDACLWVGRLTFCRIKSKGHGIVTIYSCYWNCEYAMDGENELLYSTLGEHAKDESKFVAGG